MQTVILMDDYRLYGNINALLRTSGIAELTTDAFIVDVLPRASPWESGHGNDGCIPKDVLRRLWPARPVRPRLMAQASFACSIRFMIRFASARMFTAAFTSLSCVTPHSGHVHSRTLMSLVPCQTCPHAEQVWDDG